MLIEQIIEFELRGAWPPGRTFALTQFFFSSKILSNHYITRDNSNSSIQLNLQKHALDSCFAQSQGSSVRLARSKGQILLEI